MSGCVARARKKNALKQDFLTEKMTFTIEDQIKKDSGDTFKGSECTIHECKLYEHELKTERLMCSSCRRFVHHKCTQLPEYQICAFEASDCCGYICYSCVAKNHNFGDPEFFRELAEMMESFAGKDSSKKSVVMKENKPVSNTVKASDVHQKQHKNTKECKSTEIKNCESNRYVTDAPQVKPIKSEENRTKQMVSYGNNCEVCDVDAKVIQQDIYNNRKQRSQNIIIHGVKENKASDRPPDD